MTFDEYISNPMGKNTAVMSARSMYMDKYSKQWDELKVRENGTIMYHLYKDKEDYYIHFKIPSEASKKLHYDTIVRFFLLVDDKKPEMERTLSHYQVQFYSNDPSFVYTFAYAFKTKKLLIKDLYFKMSQLALKEPAKIKNPKNEIGYVKTIFFAYLEMKHLGLFNKNKWEVIATKYNKSVWNNTVDHADDKLLDSDNIHKAVQQEKKLDDQSKKINRFENNDKNVTNNSKTSELKSPNIPNYGHFKNSGPAKFEKLVKKVNTSFGNFIKKPKN